MKFFHHFAGARPTMQLPVFSLALLSLMLLYGCQDPPEACFRVDTTVVDQNIEVIFQNCSQFQQEGYEWDFGDGGTSNAVTAAHRFTSRGTFLVNLTSKATNEINNDTYSEIIKVGNRLLTSAEVSNWPTTGPNGPWDATDDPDLALVFINGSNVEFMTPVEEDAASGQTVSFNLAASNFDLTPDDWTIVLADMDGTTAFDTMAVFTQDFALFEPVPQKQISNTTSTVSWTINYSVN